jgi:hypothetical protein
VAKKLTLLNGKIIFKAVATPQSEAFDKVAFEYRPMEGNDAAQFLNDADGERGNQVRAKYKLIARHVVKWDVADVDGNVSPITVETSSHLPNDLILAIADKILASANEADEALKNS